MHTSLSLSTAILITATAVLLVAVVLLSPVNKASAKECNNNNAHSTTCSHEEYSNNHDPSTPKDTIPLLLPFP